MREVLLSCELGGAVRGEWSALRRLLGRPIAFAVNGPACRCEHHPCTHSPRRLQDADRPDDVDLAVVVRALDRDPNVGLRRKVHARSGHDPLEERVDCLRIPDIGLDELHASNEVFAPAARKIVENGDLVASCGEHLHDVRADESRTSGDNHAHESQC